MAGLYIHIPFCESRCIYCGFYSTTLAELKDAYVGALCREMEMRLHEISEPITTIYLGGGTPSTLSWPQMERLFNTINKVYGGRWLADKPEVTMECNPDDVCRSGFRLPEEVNRVSLGAQTFNDERLRFLRRRHSAVQVETAVSRLRGLGMRNISVDLMFGFSQETMADIEYDIDRVLRLNVEHISAYSLMYEEGTPLHRMRADGKVQEIDEELSLSMYRNIVNRLKKAGFEHYEISNFALRGRRSRHNSAYWNRTPYIGIGAAAHSFNGTDTRSWNVSDVRQYIQKITEGQRPAESEVMDDDTQYDDLITTSMRTAEGLALNGLQQRYREYLLRQSETYLERGLLAIEGGRIHLTEAGIFISDTIMSDLMWG